jgi:hypothetical protein
MMGNTMTAARRRRKPLPSRLLAAGLLAMGLFTWLPLNTATRFGIGPGGALAAGQIVVDENTGLAIRGFDAVAYFTDAVPKLGDGAFEYSYGGVVWRFRNEGNRFAFMNDPSTYMPVFGGYDPLAVARGVALPGDPRIWMIAGGRLYLFRTPEARDAFAAVAEQVAVAADGRWPAVQRTLTP